MSTARYTASGDQTLTTTKATCLTVGSNASTAQRNEIYECILGVTGTPADNTISWTIVRVTALGTATAQTAAALQDGDRAAQAAAGSNHTVEPTLVTNGEVLKLMPLNARATFRWIAPPGGEWKHAATVGAGFAFQASHGSSTVDFQAIAAWQE